MAQNMDLKMLLFKNEMTQRELAFGTRINEGQISTLIRYGIGTRDIKERVSDYLNVPTQLIFREA